MSGPAPDDQVIMDVSTDGTGWVELIAGPDSLVGAQVVSVNEDVQAWFDPIDPARLVRLECINAARAQWLITELLGADTAATINDLHDLGRGSVTIHRTSALRDIARLALLLWLEAHSPLDLDQGLLDAEIAVSYDALPGPLAAAEVRRRSRAALGAVIDLGRMLGSGAGSIATHAARTAARAAGTVLASAPGLTAAETQALLNTEGAALAAGTAGLAMSSVDFDLLLLGVDHQPRPSTWNGGDIGVDGLSSRVFSVDWEVVPRGVLHSGEGTIRATWGPDAAVVSIRITTGTAAAEPLMVRVLRGEEGRVVAVAPLDLDPLDGSYRAVLNVPGGLSDIDRVDAFSPVSTAAPLRGSRNVLRAEGIRGASRGLMLMRLADALDGSPTGPQLWAAAAAEWSQWTSAVDSYTPSSLTRQRDLDVALTALARCRRQQGRSAAADRVTRHLVDPGVEPAWEDPVAAASLAELRSVQLI